MSSQDSLKTRQTLSVNQQNYSYFSLQEAQKTLGDISRLPISLKVVLENLLRFEDGQTVTKKDIEALAAWLKNKKSDHEIAFRPARVLMQDFTGVPAIVDLAAMRDAMNKLGGNPTKINPLTPVDLVIDHSVQVDQFATTTAFGANVALEMERNRERYEFLRWGQKAFDHFRVVPPGTGICHQVNLEYLAKVAWTKKQGDDTYVFPDTLVGTDSHTTMVNSLGVLGWGVGGIEAEAVMLGQPVSMLIPEVVGFKMTGKLREGITATDLVLTVTQMLRQKGVVGKFVEFFGAGLSELPLADRATVANMAPEYGATCGFFPVDKETIHYLKLTGRDEQTIALVEAYAKAQGIWFDSHSPEPSYTDVIELDLSIVEASLAGPKRPQDRVALPKVGEAFAKLLAQENKTQEQKNDVVQHGDVVIAAITSCTNTSNPSVLMAAGLLAKKAVEKGLKSKPWVKTSLAPGSKVVTDYLVKAGLQKYLDQLGFMLVGYGCTTCIGNSGPLPDDVAQCVQKNDLVVSSVLSGNRNFEGRVHPQVKANWLASPPLVVAFALLGNTRADITKESLGIGSDGKPVFLRDIWPTNAEIAQAVAYVDGAMFHKQYADVFKGDAQWQALPIATGQTYDWNNKSTYVQNPPYFTHIQSQPAALHEIKNARVLALFGDSITTDHISPAGSIKADSPAGKYLQSHGVAVKDFNSYGARRGNHEVMMRGTFANIRIRNEMVPTVEGGFTLSMLNQQVMPIYDAAMEYVQKNIPLVIFAGREYGTGSSRDWAAKGTRLLGVKAVIAESFERIHRSNLVGMGILPLEFKAGTTRKTLQLTGNEVISISGVEAGLKPKMDLALIIERQDGKKEEIAVRCRIDTQDEVGYFKNDGILPYVLRQLA